MSTAFEPDMSVLPPAQRQIWSKLVLARSEGFVLYGGTAIALRLAHRRSVDFDFFSSSPVPKATVKRHFDPRGDASILLDAPDTLVISAPTQTDPVKLSFFGNIGFGRVGEPSASADGVLLAASPLDLLATKLKTLLDRAETKDYLDVAALLRSGISLADGLGAFRTLFSGEPAQVLRAIGYFEDGDLGALAQDTRQILIAARDAVRDVPYVPRAGSNLDVGG